MKKTDVKIKLIGEHEGIKEFRASLNDIDVKFLRCDKVEGEYGFEFLPLYQSNYIPESLGVKFINGDSKAYKLIKQINDFIKED